MTDDEHKEPAPEEGGSWLAELSDAALPSASERRKGSPEPETPHFPDLPALDRVRPPRPPLVPTAVWVSAGIAFAVLALIAAGILTATSLARVAVPDIVGQSLGVATTRLQEAGLEVKVTERRFSTLPKDQVIEQTPSAGSQAQKGDTISLVVSAGSEEFSMPDVVGQGLTLAKGTLEGKGLVVVVEYVVSEDASDTVMSTSPAAGTTVRTGDTVRVQVATTSASGVTLQPYDLKGVDVVIDAAPPGSGVTSDPSMEVSRKLRALLEAADASVTMLRSSTTSSTLDADRARLASETSATVAVGFVVASTGDAGRVVSTEGTTTAGEAPPSAAIAAQIAQELGLTAPPVVSNAGTSDIVLQSTRAPWVRISLGSASQRDDEVHFADSEWLDTVAQSVYTAIGKVYGKPSSQ